MRFRTFPNPLLIKGFQLTFLALVALCPCYGQLPKGLRTDGFYLFDNGIRTVTPANRLQEQQVRQIAKALRLFNNGDLKSGHCLPDGVIPYGERNSEVDVLAFFADGTGFNYTTVCRDKEAWERLLRCKARMESPEGKQDPNQDRIQAVTPVAKNRFSFNVGFEASLPKDVNQVGVLRYGQLEKDRILVDVVLPKEVHQMPASLLAKIGGRRTYVFCKWTDMPAAFREGIAVLPPAQ